ncbi:MAG: DUF6249 domain-containing protein [Polyangia bacterium]
MRFSPFLNATVLALAVLSLGSAALGQTSDGGPDPAARELSSSTKIADEAQEKVDAVDSSMGSLESALDDLAETLDRPGGTSSEPGKADPNLAALLDHRRNMEALRHGPAGEGGAVAILVPLGFFACVFGLVFVPLLLRHRRRRLEADLQSRAIEAGMQYVPELPARPLPVRNDKRTGALLAAVGVAFAVPTALVGATQVAVFGLAPAIIGVGYVLIGLFLQPPLEG